MMPMSIEIERADNGYIVRMPTSNHICLTLEDVFNFLLLTFERRSPALPERYGKVIIIRDKEDENRNFTED